MLQVEGSPCVNDQAFRSSLRAGQITAPQFPRFSDAKATSRSSRGFATVGQRSAFFLRRSRTAEPTLTAERWFLSGCYRNPDYDLGRTDFGVRGQALWVTGPLTLGSDTAPFGETHRTTWGPGLTGLGSGAAHFGGRPCPLRGSGLTGPGSHALGSGVARFGVRGRTLWGPGSHALGSGVARFGVRGRTLWGPGSHALGGGFCAGISLKSLTPSPLSEAPVPLDLLTLL